MCVGELRYPGASRAAVLLRRLPTLELHYYLKSYSDFTEGWILPIGSVASGRVSACSERSGLVSPYSENNLVYSQIMV